MPSLQIRDLPEPLHQQLQQRARQQNRSLSQQALTELEAAEPEAMVRSDRQR
jgi:plasmid stability protein